MLCAAAALSLATLAAPQARSGTGTLPLPAVATSATSITLTWSTSQPLNTQVWYATSGGTAAHFANWKLVTAHTVTLSGLATGAAYNLQVESSNYSNPDLYSPLFTVTLDGGPPPPPTLQLTPSSATLHLGDTLTLVPSYSNGQPVGSLVWSAGNGGQISASGVFTATAAGTFVVTATDGAGLTAQATLTVQPAAGNGLPLPAVSNLTPASFTLTWATAQPLNTQVHYRLPGGASQNFANWKLVTAHSATLTGLAAGATYTVTIESSYFSNPDLVSPPFTVTTAGAPPPLLSLSPATVSLKIGDTQAFAASYSNGQTVGPLTWTVSNSGTISSAGVFTAAAAGVFTVTATDTATSLSATAQVTVAAAPPPVLQLTPATAQLTVGDSQTFTASYSNGQTVGPLAWTVSNSGAISPAGVFTAAAAGVFTVTATDTATSLSATAQVTVAAAPPPPSLTISPPDPVLFTGATLTLTAVYGDGTPATASWTATNGGAVDSVSGVFTAAAPGSFTLTATDSTGLSAMTTLQVIAPLPPPAAPSCPGCFFTSPAAAWLYAGPNPAWGLGRDLSAAAAAWDAPSLNTNNTGFGMPVQHTDGSFGSTAVNDYNYGPGWRHDSAVVPNPPGNQWTVSCGWLPPSQFGQTVCYGAYDGKDFVINDTTGDYYDIDQMYVDRQGHPINFGRNGYGTGACGGAGQKVCGLRGIFTGNLATSDPAAGGSTSIGVVSGAGVIVPGELDCTTCLNHAVQISATDPLVNLITCNAVPASKTGDGDQKLPRALLCEGGMLWYSGDWTQLDPATHSPAVIALARALALYGGLITDQGGPNLDTFSFYTGYDTPPPLTGIADLLRHLVIFYGTAILQ